MTNFSCKIVVEFIQALPNLIFRISLFSHVYNTHKNTNIIFQKSCFGDLKLEGIQGICKKVKFWSLSQFPFQELTCFPLQYLFDQYQNSNKNCQMRKYKWNHQEEQYLKFLREEKCMKSWKQIASEINQKFPESLKSSKQCREKYINYSRFCGIDKFEQNLKWSEADDQKLSALYNEYGSTWSFFTQSLVEKSQNSIKNRFYNRLKKLAKKLDDHRSQHCEQIRGTSSYDSMIRILDFSNQVKTFSIKNNIKMSPKSAMMNTRFQILHCCFDNSDDAVIPCEDLCRLTRKMKEVNIKIRCFGICKAKNRKNWKLSKRGFDSTLLFDQQQLANVKVENSDQKLVETKNALVEEENENDKEEMRNSTQNDQFYGYYPPYYYMPPPYYMMPQMPMYPLQQEQEYAIKLQQEIQNYKQFQGFKPFEGQALKKQQI